MTRKKIVITIIFITVLLLGSAIDLYGAYPGKQLNVSTCIQEHNCWCWAASSQCLLDYYGTTVEQCDLANYLFSRSDCCGAYPFAWEHPCNCGATIYNIRDVLRHWGVYAQIEWCPHWWCVIMAIEGGNPFIILRRRHATVGYGWFLKTDVTPTVYYIYIMDPWPGEGKGTYRLDYYQQGWAASVRKF